MISVISVLLPGVILTESAGIEGYAARNIDDWVPGCDRVVFSFENITSLGPYGTQ